MGIRRFRAAASLKQAYLFRIHLHMLMYPPLSGGGLIEAMPQLRSQRSGSAVSAAFGRRPH